MEKYLDLHYKSVQKSVAHLDYHVDYQYSNLGVPHISEHSLHYVPYSGKLSQDDLDGMEFVVSFGLYSSALEVQEYILQTIGVE